MPNPARALLFALTLALLSAPTVEAQESPLSQRLSGFDTQIRQVMDDWSVPGLGIAVVTDSSIVWSRGFGERNREAGAPVTDRTLFRIGSATKAFTAAGLGILRDEGKLGWSTPVQEYLPRFKMKDRFASQEMTPIDLLTHRSGLPGHDLLWYAKDFSLEELVGRLRHLEPSEPFRTTFQYSNLMYRTAGYLAGQVSGVGWETFTRQRLLAPLGMSRTTFSYDSMQQATDYARPYSGGLSTIEAIDYNHDEATSPSGSIISSVSEMTEWVQLFLNNGHRGDTQLIDSTTVAELTRPRIVRDSYLPLQDRSSWLLYALGWNVERWGGHRILFHPGGVEGFTAIVGMMPGREVGWVILTNKGVTSPARFAPFAVQYELIDRVLGRKGPNWNQRILDFYDAQQSGTAQPDASETAPDTTAAPGPSHRLEDYVGQYTNPGYGTFKVTMEGDSLTGHYGTLGSTLRHVRYDVFEVHRISPSPLGRPTFKVRFETGMDGSIDKAAIPLEPAVDPIVFTRMDPDETGPNE